MLEVQASYKGLIFTGHYAYEAPTGPSYACGGTPGGIDVWAEAVALEDPEQPESVADFLEDVRETFGDVLHDLVRDYLKREKALPKLLEPWIFSHYEDLVLDLLIEAGQNYEPDYPEYDKYEEYERSDPEYYGAGVNDAD